MNFPTPWRKLIALCTRTQQDQFGHTVTGFEPRIMRCYNYKLMSFARTSARASNNGNGKKLSKDPEIQKRANKMLVILTAATDARVAVVAVAVVFGWPSARGLSIANIADQLECSPSTMTRCIARFKTLAGLNSAGGIRPGAGSSNGDKPAAVQSVGNIPQETALIAR
jgi:hypothetical protein